MNRLGGSSGLSAAHDLGHGAESRRAIVCPRSRLTRLAGAEKAVTLTDSCEWLRKLRIIATALKAGTKGLKKKTKKEKLKLTEKKRCLKKKKSSEVFARVFVR